jgi:phosphoserine phosphatase RsbU/P
MPVSASFEAKRTFDIWEPEKDEARRIQASLIPSGPLCGAGFEIACRFSPCAGVGGDFADYFKLPNGLVGIYLGDVVGKGLPAAMYAAMVMGTLRGANKTGENTADVLRIFNKRLLARPVSGRFCSTIYALFNPATLELKFSNAGLPAPLLACEIGCKSVGEAGDPSGLFAGSMYKECSLKLAPGDAVLLATDGLHELRNVRGECFSWDELSEVWQRCRAASAEEALDHLFVKEFAAGGATRDDIIAVVVKATKATCLA